MVVAWVGTVVEGVVTWHMSATRLSHSGVVVVLEAAGVAVLAGVEVVVGAVVVLDMAFTDVVLFVELPVGAPLSCEASACAYICDCVSNSFREGS